MKIQTKLIVFMATMLVLLFVVMVGIGTWVITTIIYGLNTDLLTLKLTGQLEKLEQAVSILEESGATGIAAYVSRTQDEMLQQLQALQTTTQLERYYVITGKGYHPLFPAPSGQEVQFSADALASMIAARSGTLNFRYHGVRYFTVYRYFEPWDWLIGIALPQTNMFRQRLIYLISVSSSSLLMFLGVFTMTYMIGKRAIANPLATLVQATQAIAIGQFEHPLHFPQRDEIGQLANAIQQMAQQLRQNFAQITTQLATIQADMAERQQAEAEIRRLNAELEHRVQQRTAELETANKELKDFAYVVSHDLKAPLRAISRLVQWLVEDYAAAFDAKGKEMTDVLVNRVKRMDALIDGILEYSRIGRVAGENTAVDLNLLLTDVLDFLAPPSHIQIAIAPNLPTLTGDKIRIQQVFQNLIGNAIKFMDKPHGHITVGCVDDGSFWRFSISDNGPGIDPKHHDRIFQIFQTLQPRDEVESTGVGLSIVKKVIEFYGGTIEVTSEVGKGSTFQFTFPKMM